MTKAKSSALEKVEKERDQAIKLYTAWVEVFGCASPDHAFAALANPDFQQKVIGEAQKRANYAESELRIAKEHWKLIKPLLKTLFYSLTEVVGDEGWRRVKDSESEDSIDSLYSAGLIDFDDDHDLYRWWGDEGDA